MPKRHRRQRNVSLGPGEFLRGGVVGVTRHTELVVYQRSFEAACRLKQLSESFPAEERYSLTDQMRRSARSVSANIAEGWGRRRYPAAFRDKMNVAEFEAAATQTWIAFAVRDGYLSADIGNKADACYDEIIAMLVTMIRDSDRWCSIRHNDAKKSTKSAGVHESSQDYNVMKPLNW